MRILILTSEYPPQRVFGLGRFVADLAEELARQGHEVVVITNSMEGTFHDSIQNGVRILRVDFPPPPKPPLVSGQILIFNIQLLRRAVSLGHGTLSSFDVVCSHDWLTSPAAQAISEEFGMPHVCTFHDVVNGKRLGSLTSAFDLFSERAEQWVVDNATYLIANSKSTKDELVALYHANTNKIAVIPCSVSPQVFDIEIDPYELQAFREVITTRECLLILYVGRLDTEKGVHILLESFSKADTTNRHLCIAGIGALRESLEALAQTLNISDKVSFIGYVENPCLAALYRCADIFVCTSIYEPFGLVVIEAMLHHLPVIASNTGGLKEIITNNVNGILVETANIAALTSALDQLSSSPETRTRLGAAANTHVLINYTWTRAAAETVAHYQSLSRAIKTRTPNVCTAIFIASDLHSIAGYSAGSHSRRVAGDIAIDSSSEQPIAVVTVSDGDFFPIPPIDRCDEALLRAFQLSVKLLRFTSGRPKFAVLTHWNACLALSVLSGEKDKIVTRLYCPPLRFLKAEQENDVFEREMWMMAGSVSMEVFVEDSSTTAILSQWKVESKHFNVSQSNIKLECVAPPLLRQSLAGDARIVILIGLRLEHPFSPRALIILWDSVGRAQLPVHWIICGDGSHRALLISEAGKRGLSATFPGYISQAMLLAFASTADFAVVPFEAPVYSQFIEESLSAGLKVLAPIGTSALLKGKRENLHEVNLADPENIIRLIKRLMKVGAARVSPKSIINVPDRLEKGLVLFNDWGLGDELMLTAVARELKRVYPDLKVWVRSRFGFEMPGYIERGEPAAGAIAVETIYQNPVLYGPEFHSPFPGHLVQQMLNKVELETGLRVVAENTRPAIVVRQAPMRREGVIIHSRPNTRLPSKDWGLTRWERLAEILNGFGIPLIQVGAPGEGLLPHVLDKRGIAPKEVPELVAHAQLVICLVGFLMHVAAGTETPALVIYGGREHPAIDGYSGQFHLSSDALDCRGRWGCHLAPDMECPYSMRCMNDITPDMVGRLASLAILGSSGKNFK